MTKEDLLSELDEAGKELAELLSEPGVASKSVRVPWSKEPVRAIQSLEGLSLHDCPLHDCPYTRYYIQDGT